MNMRVKFYGSNPLVRATAGKTAVMYGPVLYCAESKDNEKPLFTLRPDKKAGYELRFDEYFCADRITLKAFSSSPSDSLYFSGEIQSEECTLELIPYYAFANRGECDMSVWFNT